MKPLRLSRRHAQHGFALVEIMIAAVILASAFVTLFAMIRLGDWENIQSRIQARAGRLTRRFSDQVTYAPYDLLGTGELETGYLYQPVDTKGRRDFPFYPDPATTPYLSVFPYRVECNVQVLDAGLATERKVVSLQVYYTGQKSFVTGKDAIEVLFYDNGGSLVRSRY